jgi:hypothetical protein
MSKPDTGKAVKDYIRATYGKPHEPPREPPASASEVLQNLSTGNLWQAPTQPTGSARKRGRAS